MVTGYYYPRAERRLDVVVSPICRIHACLVIETIASDATQREAAQVAELLESGCEFTEEWVGQAIAVEDEDIWATLAVGSLRAHEDDSLREAKNQCMGTAGEVVRGWATPHRRQRNGSTAAALLVDYLDCCLTVFSARSVISRRSECVVVRHPL